MRKFIQIGSPAIIGNEKKYVNDCLNENWISSAGKYINKFEKKFAKFSNVKYAVSCSSGTSALHISLLSLNVKEGDEIIVPTFTYIATANAITYCGARPVFVDIDPETFCINEKLIKSKITSKTKGIIAVHLFGHPANMDPILKLAKEHKLFVIEDNAQGLGAKYKGRRTGSIGTLSSFSFFGSKMITTGEGGMVTTNSYKLAERLRLLKGQGVDPKRRYWFPIVGYNYRMTNIEAAIGLAQLEKINLHIKNRRNIALNYIKELKDNKDLILPIEKSYASNAYWLFNVTFKKKSGIDRDKVIKYLIDNGIDARHTFYPLDMLPPYKKNDMGKFPIAKSIFSRTISLPTHENLSQVDILYISKKLKYIVGRISK